MKRNVALRCCEVALACALALPLAGCKIGPLELPDLPIPDLFATTSVAEAIEASQAKRTPSLNTPTISTYGVLTVGVTPTTLPFTYQDSSGEYTGLDIDVASALADELGLKVRFVQVANGDDAINQGCDVYMATTAAGAPNLYVVGPYEESASALFRKGDAGVISASDLTGKTIGVQSSSNSASVLSRMIIDATAREYDSINDAFAALDTGTVDYVICDAYMGAFVARTYDDLNFCGTVTEAVPMGMGTYYYNMDLQDALEAAMQRLATGGQLGLLRSRWVGKLPNLTEASRVAGVTVGASSTSEPVEVPEGAEVTEDGTAGDGSTAGSNAVTLD